MRFIVDEILYDTLTEQERKRMEEDAKVEAEFYRKLGSHAALLDDASVCNLEDYLFGEE